MNKRIKKRLEIITRFLIEECDPEKIILFGSLSKNYSINGINKGFDIDIFVKFNYDINFNKYKNNEKFKINKSTNKDTIKNIKKNINNNTDKNIDKDIDKDINKDIDKDIDKNRNDNKSINNNINKNFEKDFNKIRYFRKLKEKIDNIAGIYTVDLVFSFEIEDDFKSLINKTGVVLYEKSRS